MIHYWLFVDSELFSDSESLHTALVRFNYLLKRGYKVILKFEVIK